MYRKILVPHDGSKYSARAAEKAMELAKMSGAKIVFVNATVLPSLVYTFQDAANAAINDAAQQLVEASEDSATRMLKEQVAASKKKGLEASFVHRVGDPAQVILEAARAENADLVVMGSKGLSGLSKLRALGSVTRKVTEHSPCPVLIVH
ncbi:MAG: universal stress protein [Nitrososphaera sp.]|uniref:universal stress protein n=1 Tax=Nitrososphaera sp. TaxID=1971748 RepID=UPI00181E1EC0|nr:universal stress protein [Nitrososphaera sp.]NWG36828.1 universal stress protein [Nitrososphaera sp.]